MSRLIRFFAIGTVPVCALLGLAGCFPMEEGQGGASSGDASLLEQVLALVPRVPVAADSFSEIETNNELVEASPISFEESVALVGTIASGSTEFDRDLYELGPADAGDRIQASLNIHNGNDIIFCLFDDQQRLLAYIDHSSYATGPREIDLIVREATNLLFAMADTRSSSSVGRAYTATVSLEPGVGLPEYRPQVVVLDFIGASGVRIGNRAPVDVPPFDVANIDPRFAGQTDAIIDLVMEMVREDYAGLNVAIYEAGDPAIPAGSASVIYFGTYDPGLLGLADNIDPFNADTSQSAILYTDTFSLFNPLIYDITALAQVLANVASHETGHLLGLRHTIDAEGIMDVTATARQMLREQWFKVSALHSSVASLGYQDAPAMLEWTVGGELNPPSAAKLASRLKSTGINEDVEDYEVPRHMLSSCGHIHWHEHDTPSDDNHADE